MMSNFNNDAEKKGQKKQYIERGREKSYHVSWIIQGILFDKLCHGTKSWKNTKQIYETAWRRLATPNDANIVVLRVALKNEKIFFG